MQNRGSDHRRRRRLATCAFAGLLAWPLAGFGQIDIVINEIMYDPGRGVNDNNGEWFELYNAGSTAVDINGWIIKDDASANEKHTISNTGGLSIAAGAYLVLGRNNDTSLNGGVTVDYVYSTVSLSNSTDGLILANASDTEQDKVVWGTANSFPDPSNSASIALKGTSLDNIVGANWCISTKLIVAGGNAGTPGAANSDCLVQPAFTGEIWQIQGSGASSPYVRSSKVTTNDNIVTAVGAGGFFMQTPASRSDNKADTSDGIFVVHAGSPTVAVGDQVDVAGEVEEYFAFTRFKSGATVTVDASNQTVPAPVEFNASRPAPNPASANCAMEPECYEGMRIRIARGTVTTGSQYFGSDNTAEMYVRPSSGRAFREPGARYPGVSGRPGIPVWDGNPEVFELDPDKLGLTNVSWAPGTGFSATGVLGYEYGGYELWATELTSLGGGMVLPQAVRAKATGEVTVASLNLLNLRETSNDTKYDKLSLYIRQVLGAPDVIGVQEVYQQAALTKLANEIKTDDSGVVYTAYVKQTANSQAVGFLVRSGVSVETGFPKEHGSGETFVDPRDNSNDPVHDRLPIYIELSVGDFDFTVIDVHNRSRIDIDDAARGEWVRTKRLAQAQSVAKLVQQESDKGSKVIVVGDFNGFEFTDGYVDVVNQIKGNVKPGRNQISGPDLVDPNLCNLVDGLPATDRYSHIFQGNAQALDHALVNPAMSRHVVGDAVRARQRGRRRTEPQHRDERPGVLGPRRPRRLPLEDGPRQLGLPEGHRRPGRRRRNRLGRDGRREPEGPERGHVAGPGPLSRQGRQCRPRPCRRRGRQQCFLGWRSGSDDDRRLWGRPARGAELQFGRHRTRRVRLVHDRRGPGWAGRGLASGTWVPSRRMRWTPRRGMARWT